MDPIMSSVLSALIYVHNGLFRAGLIVTGFIVIWSALLYLHKQVPGGSYRATLTICNVPESSLIRASKLRFLTRAGPEIGVASTKAFTTQLASLFVLALVMGRLRGRLARDVEQAHLQSLRHLPAAINEILAVEPRVAQWAARFATKEHALFLGRGIH